MSRAAGIAPVIVDVGALCAVGRGVDQVYASVRAGLARIVRSPVHDRRGEPIRMALVPEDALDPLGPALERRGLPGRARRIVRLAAPALRAAAASVLAPGGAPAAPGGARTAPPAPSTLALFLGLPEGTSIAKRDLVTALAEQSGVALDEAASQVFPRGRAAALLALEAALRFLTEGRGDRVLVGGADSHLDLSLLSGLDREQRLLGARVADGFIPGEGAAFLLLATARTATAQATTSRPRAAVLGVGAARDPGHRYSAEPARGEGLAQAIEALRAALPGPPSAPIESTYASFNGESFQAKEWGVARLRHSELFSPGARIEHPADCYGDAGAATGALLLALAATALARGDRTGPALVFASSDREDRACALVDNLA